jgi:hypothetical protein
MKRGPFFPAFLVALLLVSALGASQKTITTKWEKDAAAVYDTGFASGLMKHSGGVGLFNMDLVENDAPGSGISEKGVSTDVIWGKTRARKVLPLVDPRAERAWIVVYVFKKGRHPLTFTVNGREARLESWNEKENNEWYRWTDFPANWLKKGDNTIELFCPEASSPEEGWEIQIARADEFADGGGDPGPVGRTSFKSIDGGRTWRQSPFGPDEKTRAEYTVRLSLDRYIRSGWLASPVIDLWKGDDDDFIVPLRRLAKVRLQISADVAPETRIRYFLRKGDEPGPFSEGWTPYEPVGDGASLDVNLEGADLNRRYIQFKAELSTTNPLQTPLIKSARVEADLTQNIPDPKNLFIAEIDNPEIRYSSLDWEWEKDDRPEFETLRRRENLDEIVRGSRTQFEAMVRLSSYVARRWRNNSPLPDYPGWDALSIFNRIDRTGGGGMCIQLNLAFGGACMAYGWQARHVNVIGHEVIEIWNDELGKWVFFDADYFQHYNADAVTGEPLDLLEIHRKFLDYYFPDRAIDWMKDRLSWMGPEEGRPFPVLRGSSVYLPDAVMSGFINAAFLRIIPRNNWYEKPTPRPLNHGMSQWPWNGYVNWYDERTPPKRQYSHFTDRARDLWPDLNRVHVGATSGAGNDVLFLHFETYTPNFSHFEVDVDETGWTKTDSRWAWHLQSGRNTLRVRAVSRMGVAGKPSRIVLNHVDQPFSR